MARVKITEYSAKRLLLGDTYSGVALSSTSRISFPKDAPLVVKVDQGIKKRMKQGLVAVDIAPQKIAGQLKEWEKRGFSSFLVEELVPHEQSEEQYLSLERVRTGIRLLHARVGGIDIEEHPESLTQSMLTADSIPAISNDTGLPETFLQRLLAVFVQQHFSFLEINPLVVREDTVYLLDAAVLVDSAAQFFVRDGWTDADITEASAAHAAEATISELQKTTPASLKLKVLNPNGSIFFLLSGGGGSIVAADEAALKGMGSEIGNYGEYSGGPTREETYLYAKEVLALLLASKAKKKTLVIAGGVANFTDVKTTFAGIEDALSETAESLRRDGVRVFVRRGGPNEKEGLSHMKEFLTKEGLLGVVYGSSTAITEAVDDAVATL
ncbi:hypothetical protein KJ819_02365 [Patescibacteria group bacterium]|nr:hypothetical protein [Patescibacteria group bacterium]MBU1500874.1 hypothetical protein [Patescibacteria group bacterium]MBU2080929.1 hypothetical protein [Patescibacteria group bacterium]MBU2124034.1 hypothetical protein [Patescibacteria group bacterium]MBU2194675.1 hypothetical protein [Patescibacteria group bacterium]